MSWCCEGRVGNQGFELGVEDVGHCDLDQAVLHVYCYHCQRQGTWTLYADKEEATLEMGEVRI